jgi:hypothetical protein
MDNIIGVNNPYGLVQQAGRKRRRRTYRKKHTLRNKTRKFRKLFRK